MKVVWFDEIEVWPVETVLTVGVFDGVHLGHREIVRTARAAADRRGCQAVAMTFGPHPTAAAAPAERPNLLTTLDQRLELLEVLGLDAVAVARRLPALFALEAEEFVERVLVRTLRAREVVEGSDWTFGRGRRGDLRLLRGLGARLGFDVTVVPWVMVAGRRVSSTVVRGLLAAGEVSAAADALGRHYSVDGAVVAGAGRGGGLGFPTANLIPLNEVLPAPGVYAGWGAVAGRAHTAAIFIGRAETFDATTLTLEVHLLDYVGSALRGARMRVGFVRRLRDVEKLPDRDALAARIRLDVEEARRTMTAEAWRAAALLKERR
jgi:riboflavin kinase/FMN adenylyltransferase